MTSLADLLASSSIARDNTRTSNNNWWGARQKTERKDNQKLLVGDRLDQIQLIYKSGAKSKKWLEDICWNTKQGLKFERFFIHFEGLGSHNFLVSIPRFSRVLHQFQVLSFYFTIGITHVLTLLNDLWLPILTLMYFVTEIRIYCILQLSR